MRAKRLGGVGGLEAITVLQPWAWLLASGKKHCETQPWKTDYRGKILIHAGEKDFTNALRQTFLEERYMRQAGVFDTEMITGAIIGKAKLVNCVFVDEAIRDLMREQHMEEYAFGYFVPNQYAWVFEEAELFKHPFPITGKRGLWDFDEEMCIKRLDIASALMGVEGIGTKKAAEVMEKLNNLYEGGENDVI